MDLINIKRTVVYITVFQTFGKNSASNQSFYAEIPIFTAKMDRKGGIIFSDTGFRFGEGAIGKFFG